VRVRLRAQDSDQVAEFGQSLASRVFNCGHRPYRAVDIFFAVLFGLSMDYEVFLLSRIRAEYDATGDNAESVARGIASTGPVITSAALIMTVVFLSFVAHPSPLVKMLGLGLATAIVLDATIVRMVVVPAVMALLGRWTWWLPSRLDRRLPPH
jgi:RND superfamily putative drug exporter